MSRVLVADDDAAIRKVVRDALERAGHEVETAADGEEAVARFAEGAGAVGARHPRQDSFAS